LEVVRVGIGIGDSWVGTSEIGTTNNTINSKLNDIINTIRKKQKPDTNNLIPGTNYKKGHSLRYKHCM
jgi:hypothetical protein